MVKYTKEFLLEELKRARKEHGFPLTMESFKFYSKIHPCTIQKRFNGWEKACKLAGVECFGKEKGRTKLYLQNIFKKVVSEIFGDIEFLSEKSFDDLKNPKTNKYLYFDFYLPYLNILIEVDGFSHHNKEMCERIFKGNFEENQYRDQLKNNYAILKNINLIRIKQEKISYNYIKNILLNYKSDNILPINQEYVENNLFKIEEIKSKISKEKMQDLYENQNLSDHKIAKLYNCDYSLIYRLRNNIYKIQSRSNKIQKKKKINLKLLKECLSKKLTYDKMEKVLCVNRAIIYKWKQRILKNEQQQ